MFCCIIDTYYFICIYSYVIEDDLAPSRKNVWTVSIQYSYHQDQEVTLQLTYILCATFIHDTCCSTFTTMYIHMIFFHWAFVSYYKTSYQAVLFKRKIMYIILAIQSIFVIYSASTTSILYNISSFNNQNVQTRTNKIIIQRYSNFQLKKQRLFIWGHMYAIHKIVSIFYVFI